jgi:hypothetical protein
MDDHGVISSYLLIVCLEMKFRLGTEITPPTSTINLDETDVKVF